MKRTSAAGFTLLETISVIAIIATIIAITLPVYRSALLSAKAQASIQRLHQFHLAISMYQQNWDFKGYDTVEALALPPLGYAFGGYGGLFAYPDDFRSPCGYHASFDSSGLDNGGIGYYMTYAVKGSLDRFQKFRQNSLMIYDFQCNPAYARVSDPFQPKRSLGLLMSGQVADVYDTGDVHNWGFYAKPPE